MFKVFPKVQLFIIMSIALFLAGCATPGLLEEKEEAYITSVIVTKTRPGLGSVNMAEDVRVKILQQTRRFSPGGRPKTLKVVLTHFRAKDGITGLLISDVSFLTAVATLIDNQTNKVDASFEVGAQDHARAGGGLIGLIATNFDSPIWVEQRLASDLAEKTIVKIYGSDRLKKTPAPGAIPPANYPARYGDLVKKHKCDSAMEFPTPETSGGSKKTAPAKCS